MRTGRPLCWPRSQKWPYFAYPRDSTDPASRVAATLAALTQRIENIGEVINAASKATVDVAVSERAENAAQAAQLAAHNTEAMQIAALQVQQALTTTLVPVTKALEQWRADSIAFSQAQAQARVQQRTLDEKRADERARIAAAVDPAVLAALERVSIALQQAQLAVTVHNPANPGISELVRLQTMLIEQSLVPLRWRRGCRRACSTSTTTPRASTPCSTACAPSRARGLWG
jgi:hypothetical protein